MDVGLWEVIVTTELRTPSERCHRGENVFPSPEFAAGRRDDQIQAAPIGHAIGHGFHFGFANFGVS
jgi:hypothetical protein